MNKRCVIDALEIVSAFYVSLFIDADDFKQGDRLDTFFEFIFKMPDSFDVVLGEKETEKIIPRTSKLCMRKFFTGSFFFVKKEKFSECISGGMKQKLFLIVTQVNRKTVIFSILYPFRHRAGMDMLSWL
jgi:hypothetical protein